MDYNIFHLLFRRGITFKEVCEESKKVNKEMIAPWEEITLPTILARYQLKDMNLVCSTKHCHQNRCTSEVSIVQVENTAKCG